MNAGVYKITCEANGRSYIGSSAHARNRWTTHRWHLRRGSHPNPHMQAAWTKYSEAAFCFTIVELVRDVDELVAIEQRWIDSTHDLFNIRKYAVSNRGTARTDEQKASRKRTVISPEGIARISQANRARPRRPEELNHLKTVNIGRSHSIQTRQRQSERMTGRKYPQARKQALALNKAKAKRYVATSPNGESIEFVNMRQFCRDHNLTQILMSRTARGIQSHHKGWIVREIPNEPSAFNDTAPAFLRPAA